MKGIKSLLCYKMLQDIENIKGAANIAEKSVQDIVADKTQLDQ